MRVDVTPASLAGCVEFSGRIGAGIARWGGVGGPVEGRFDVEFEVSLPIPWSSIAILECGGEDRVEVSAVGPTLVDVLGRVLDCDEEGVLSLAVGATHLLLDTTGEPILGVVDRRVRVNGLALELFPYDL